MGTIAYMSPEQARGEKVDQRTDIWSLGVVLYEMFSGQLPFKGEHDQAVVYSILNEKPESITHLRSEIPVPIEQVVGKTLEKNPDERYQQIEELIDDLKSISEGIVPEGVKARLRKAKLLRRKRAILFAGISGFLIIMTVVALSLFTGRDEAIDSIAVLPLENLTGDAEQEYFVDGVTDELIGQLAQISALRVISRRSVMQYKESDKSLPEIARELNVDAVVEGTVHRIGESVRIRVQLIDVLPEEQNLWAETYDRAMTDVLAMYGEMARAIVGEIKVKLTAEEETHFATARQVNPEAYEAYLKGWFHKDKMTSPDLETALKYFELALEKDPNFARAYVGISGVWGTRTQMGLLPPHEAMPQAKAAAEKAVELDDTLAEVHHKLAGIRTWGDWDWEGAEKAFRRAIGINPSYPDVRSAYSHFLHIMGRPDEAMVQIERALELDPFNAKIQAFYGFDLLFLRQYDDAIEQFQNTLKTVPNHPLAHSGLLDAFYAKRMYEEALAEVRFFAEGDREYEDALARGYKEGGFPGAMNLSAELLAVRSRTTYVSPSDIAILYAYAGKYDQAFEWLERGFEEHDPNMPYINLTPAFEPLCNDSRFKDLLRRMNLPELQ